MKETEFIKQNKEKWVDFEKHLRQNRKDPDKLSSEFIQVTDDLSYSRTFYPNRSVRVYLNNVAQKVFHSIYKGKSKRWQKFREFWADELPQLVYESRKNLSTAAIIFIFSFAIGWLSSVYNPEFPRQILGDAYIEMTKANIESGDPMKVYKESREIDMLIGITLNNLMVAALAFVMGALFSIGSIGVLIVNGIMVGCFQYFFYERGLFVDSFLTIWLHGTLEISAIVISGGAGLTLGSGIVFPGTYTRGQAFRIGAFRGMKIMIGVMPIIVFAAIIESFITRYTDVPDLVKFLLILVSAIFIIGYFVVFPILKAKRGFKRDMKEIKLPPTPDDVIHTDRVRDSGELFKDAFLLYRRVAGKLVAPALIMALMYALVFAWLRAEDTGYAFSLQAGGPMLVENAFSFFSDISGYFEYEKSPWMFPANLVFFSLISWLSMYYYRKYSGEPELKLTIRYFFTNYWKSLVIGSLISALFFLPIEGGSWLVVLTMPFFLTWLAIMHKAGDNLFNALGKTFDYVFGSFARCYAIYLILLLVTFLSMAVLSMPQIVWFAFEVLYWFVDIEGDVYWQTFVTFFTFVTMSALALVMPLFLSAYGILYFTLREIRQAPALKMRVENIGKPKPKKPIIHTTIVLIALSLVPLSAKTQSNNELQELLDSLEITVEAAQATDSAYYYDEYYQDSSYYHEQDQKRKGFREYFGKEIKEKDLGASEWKKAIEGLDYSEQKEKKKAKEILEGPEWDFDKSDGLFASGVARILLFVMGAAIIALIFYLIIRNTLLRKNTAVGKKQVTTLDEAAENIHESDLERFLRESLSAGEFNIAIRVYYLILIRELSDHDHIRWKKDKTNREYLVEMRPHAKYKEFFDLTRIFEYVWYGEMDLKESDFTAIKPRFTGFIDEVKKGGVHEG